MPMTPRQMARLKAEFRAGQARYNRLVQLHGNLKRRFEEFNRLEKERKSMVGNLSRAIGGTAEIYGTPAETHRMMLLWHARERKLQQKYNRKQQEISRHVANMRPLIREYYNLRYSNRQNNNTNNSLWLVARNNIDERVFSPKRHARLKLARMINRAATRPGGWVYKRMFKEGNRP